MHESRPASAMIHGRRRGLCVVANNTNDNAGHLGRDKQALDLSMAELRTRSASTEAHGFGNGVLSLLLLRSHAMEHAMRADGRC